MGRGWGWGVRLLHPRSTLNAPDVCGRNLPGRRELCGECCEADGSRATNFAVSIRMENTSSIFTVLKRGSCSKRMEAVMAIRQGNCPPQTGTRPCKATE